MATKRKTGWVACDYTQGNRLADVRHGPIRRTTTEAMADERPPGRDLDGYEGIRYVHTDGYLYVDRPLT